MASFVFIQNISLQKYIIFVKIQKKLTKSSNDDFGILTKCTLLCRGSHILSMRKILFDFSQIGPIRTKQPDTQVFIFAT